MIEVKQKHLIHTVLGHSYLFFILFFAVGIVLDKVFPIPFANTTLEYVGIGLVFSGTMLALWAQTAAYRSSDERHTQQRDESSFARGPYRFTRFPTQLAIFFLNFGFGLATDLLWVSIAAVVALCCGYLFFTKRQSKILENRYGESYKRYRSKVRF
mgnify:CR=1 FL=1